MVLRLRKGLVVTLPDLVEVSLVKDEEKLIFVVETLHGVRDARRKVPDVAVTNLGGLEDAVFVDGGNGDAAVVDDAPFGLACQMLAHGIQNACNERDGSSFVYMYR